MTHTVMSSLRGWGKTTRVERELREAIERGEHVHHLRVGEARCWNGDNRCAIFRAQQYSCLRAVEDAD